MDKKHICIRMLKTVKPDFPISSMELNTIAEIGKQYYAVSNKYGAISVICENEKLLGVVSSEFDFVDAPDWLLKLHNKKLIKQED